LIGLGALVHYGWAFFPAQHQADAFNALGAFGRLVLMLFFVGVLWLVYGRPALILLCVAAWWACEELMVIGCSVAYIVSPWEVKPNEAQCSALLQFDLGRLGVFVVVCLLASTVKAVRCAKE
jgi:hypothetical protein